MKSGRHALIKLFPALVVLALLNSACDLTNLVTGVCSSTTLNVTKTEDTNDGICTLADCSLREAVVTSNSCEGVQTIQVPAGIFTLTRTGADEEAADRGDLDITDSVKFLGEQNSVIDGNASDRIFDIKAGPIVSISTLVLQNGQTPLFGSAIANQGSLTMDHVTLQNNVQTDPEGSGGTVYTYDLSSSLDIYNSAIVNNSAAGAVAGLYNVVGTMTIENVTISGNHGYGIANEEGGQTHVKYSTVADNSGYQIWNPGDGWAVDVANSILAGNTTQGNCFQTVSSGSFNIDSATNGTAETCGLEGLDDLVGVDPLLLPLADNGGGTPTRALDPLSPAIDSANPALCGGADQRDIPRPQGTNCDRGAFELQNPQARPTFTPVPARTRSPEATATPRPQGNTKSPYGVTLTLSENANCRKGPGTDYTPVGSLEQDRTVAVLGQNSGKTWVLIQMPASSRTCWVAVSLGSLDGSLTGVPFETVPPVPAAPGSFADSATCTGSQRKVTLTWTTASDAGGYHIYRDGKLVATLNAWATSYTDAPDWGKDYEYEIESFNDYGVSSTVATTALACK